MRQLTFIEPGVLEWRAAPDPKIETPTDAIVRPITVALCDLDAAVLRGKAPLSGPYAFGHEFVAEVVMMGEQAAGFHQGRRFLV